ncbi:hypothetical protein RJ639_043495, partial [Escallonia herrerae]
NMTANSSSIASAPARSDDPAWAHGKVVAGKRNNTICIHCDKQLKGGGITRLKMHLAGVTGQVEACKKALHDMMTVKILFCRLIPLVMLEKGKGRKLQLQVKRKRVSSFFAPRTTPGSQPSIKSAMATKEMVDNAKLAVARWWYNANAPFNGAHSKYY